MEERGEYIAGLKPLTPREREILGFIAVGEKQTCIAFRLKLSQQTVSWHQKNLLNKLGAFTSAHAVNIAWNLGILRPDENDREK